MEEKSLKYNSIIISGYPFTGKTSLAKEISKFYGWKFFDDGSNPKEIVKAFERGDVVGDFVFTKDYETSSTFKIFLFADSDTIERIASKRMNLNRNSFGFEIECRIFDLCRELRELGEKKFGKNYSYDDMRNYDRCINMSKIPVINEIPDFRNLIKEIDISIRG